MKNVLSLILIASLILISGCSSISKICHICENSHPEDANYCPNCGVTLISDDDEIESETQVIDYSDFGFQNNYGMTEWMEIKDYDFSNKSEAFVSVKGGNMVISFENGYLEERLFSGTVFSGNRNEGELYDTERFNIVSNYVIEKQITNYPTLELTEVELVNNIPIIHTDEYHYECLIPTHFIDFSRTKMEQLEYNDVHIGKYYITVYKYYIKEEFLSQ